MKTWNFQVNRSPKEIGKKLESSLGAATKFVFITNYEKKMVKFKIRKRMLLAFEILAQNNIIVNGKIVKSGTENQTDVEISFSFHPFSKLLLYIHIFLGLGFLAAIILKISNNNYMFLVAGILLTTGILFGLHLQKIFYKHVKEYKMLISEILEF